ncbi:hypothetical protein M413DRAFT_30735 [Hebeloma cylindrosporum]|uniref:Uncharacterized protein n=1 Tax=Hebeloma cylindrosporum TaxID=76867 RepID=A0A0C2XJ31_HEBCY|nr:hypothetical protein M413DRAFT_30735 [Hebeloma cylindrosporum h7]
MSNGKPTHFHGQKRYFSKNSTSSVTDETDDWPTVTHLDIAAFKGFPATAISHCSNLIHLQLSDMVEIAPSEVGHDQTIRSSKIPTLVSLYLTSETYDGLAVLLNSAGLHAGGPFIDFSRLERAPFDMDSPDDIDHIIDLIKTTMQLEYLYIDMSWPVVLTGLGPSLAINAYRTLKFLELSIVRARDDYDPLCGLSHELTFISGINVLEKIVLDVVVQPETFCRTDSDDWSALDLVLTESGAFPMLHRVSVEIWWFLSCIGVVDDEDPLLESFMALGEGARKLQVMDMFPPKIAPATSHLTHHIPTNTAGHGAPRLSLNQYRPPGFSMTFGGVPHTERGGS